MFFARVFLPFALAYFLSQLFRSVNAVVSADLITELSLDAWTIGFLTSAYFLAFAGAQLPIGVALDRFGARRTEASLLVFAAAGSFLFALAGSAAGLVVGRALIGLGVAACLMASFHAFVLWAPAERLPFLNGAVMAVGAAGALTATSPVERAVAAFGWRPLFLALAAATVVVAALLFCVAPEERKTSEQHLKDVARGIARVFRNLPFWSIAPLSVLHQGSYLALQSLWAGPWLRDVAGLDRASVAHHLLLLALGMGIGFLSLGFIAERIGRRDVGPLAVWVVSALVFQSAQGGLVLGWVSQAKLLWLVFGVSGASGMLSYVILTRRFPVEMAGRVNTGLNLLVFTGAFSIQAGVGAVIESWTPTGASFSPTGYRVAFGGLLLFQGLGLLWLLATTRWRARETAPARV